MKCREKEEESSACPRKLRWDNNSFTENVQTPSQLATGTPRPTFGLEFLHFYISFNFSMSSFAMYNLQPLVKPKLQAKRRSVQEYF